MYTQSKDSLILRLSNTDMRRCSNAVMTLLDKLQDMPHDTQCMSSAVLFLCLCERYDLRPSDVLRYADNMTRKSGGYSQANFEAVKAYMKNELED